MTIFLFAVTIILLLFSCYSVVKSRFANLCLCLCSDEDMKIADGFYTPNFKPKDNDNSIAEEFIKNRDNGNMEIAESIGSEYGEALVLDNKLINFDDINCTDAELIKQKCILFAFAVKTAAEQLSPNSAVAQKIISSFYATVEKMSKLYCEIISDSFSFSFYILWQRSSNISDEPVGSVFAKLLNKSGDSSATELGDSLFKHYYSFCAAAIKQKQFA